MRRRIYIFYIAFSIAGIGFVSSVVSDSLSNSIRVVKTYRQTNKEPISYPETVKRCVVQDACSQGSFENGILLDPVSLSTRFQN